MNDEQEKPVRVGSRKSQLALIQTKYVIGRLQQLYPKKKFEIHTMSTIGDRVLNISLPKIGEKSLFTRDLEEALRSGGVDLVVHSLKDLPTALPTGMAIGAVLEREDASDALVLNESNKEYTIETLPEGSVIGTSSLRRTAQIRRRYPHLIVCDIRGNLNTRLAKLDAPGSRYAGIILARAGLVRMGWTGRINQVLEPAHLLYAVGQGALAVECRSNDSDILPMLQQLTCLSTACCILAERSFLKTLGGGCSAPVAVSSFLNGQLADAASDSACNLRLIGAVWSLDGKTELRDEDKCCMEMAAANGSEANDDGPPAKRARVNDSHSNSNSNSSSNRSSNSSSSNSNNKTMEADSPPVINDDIEVDALPMSYGMAELIEKHAQLVKKCPYLDGKASSVCVGARDATKAVTACPLHVEIGQDFMGECPFNKDAAKVLLEGNCSDKGGGDASSNEINKNGNEKDLSVLSSKQQTANILAIGPASCPFVAKATRTVTTAQDQGDIAHDKCPFLQKSVQMFDYSDGEQPQPNNVSALIEEADNLFCGMICHRNDDKELLMRSKSLGQQLAHELIKKGALDIMKCAQAEIHAKD